MAEQFNWQAALARAKAMTPSVGGVDGATMEAVLRLLEEYEVWRKVQEDALVQVTVERTLATLIEAQHLVVGRPDPTAPGPG
jgi:hypothetical protein